MLAFGLILGFGLAHPPHAYAKDQSYIPPGSNGYNCGVTNPGTGGLGDADAQAAGLVVNVRWTPYGGVTRDDSTARVRVTTVHDTTTYPWDTAPAIMKMQGPSGLKTPISDYPYTDNAPPLDYKNTEIFSQVPANCAGMGGDNTGVVLGYGNTSPNGGGWYHWALDCEENLRGVVHGLTGQDKYQPFSVTSPDTPAGAIGGGTWQAYDHDGNPITTFHPTNGTTTYITLVYTEPAPPNESTGVCNKLDISNPDDGDKATRVAVYASGVPGISNPPDPLGGAGTFAPDVNGSKDSKTWTHNFTPNANSIDVVTVSVWYKPDDPNKGWHYYRDSNNNVIKYYLKSDGNFAQITYTYDSTNHVWNEDSHPTISCYSATCSIDWVDGDGPWNGTFDPDGSPHNVVLVGGNMYLHGTFTNTSTNNLTMWAGAFLDGPNGVNNLGFVPYGGYPVSFPPITLTAPGSVQNYGAPPSTLRFTPQYNASESNMSSCPMPSVPVYQQFGAAGVGHSELLPTKENPNRDNYYTRVDISSTSYAVNLTTNSQLNKNGGGALVSNTGGQYSGSTYTLGGSATGADYPVSSVTAGDQYCASVRIYPTSGWVGPDHNVVGGTGDQTWSSCDKVTNEPYFKVVGDGASAGGKFKDPVTGQCDGGGLLAGWNNNTNGVDRGAGSQLSALALIKITGFASAQTNIANSPTGLTFSNTQLADITSDTDSPSLGGNYNSGGSVCLPDVAAKSGATTQTGPYPQPGISGISGITNSQSVFVNGDVRITGDITYGSGWALGNVPSFVLHATGNIYIDPGVTQLDGLYVSNQKIYTCDDSTNGGTGFSPMPAAAIYVKCNNQLVIHGNFIANQVNLMRSFGSLRDETPIPGTSATSATTLGTKWSCGGDGCNPDLSGYRCIHTYEGSDPDTWQDNQLCVPSSSSLSLAWTAYAGDPVSLSGCVAGGYCSKAYLQANGYPYCTQWNVPADYAQTWNDNYLCSNQNKNFTFTTTPDTSSSRECTKIIEPADPEGQWASGYYLCGDITPATPAGPPTAPTAPLCSNKGTQLITSTCAAEIFQFSPELYISTPYINPPSNGATQYDAITSLPPVL
jgi:hypothetical protein